MLRSMVQHTRAKSVIKNSIHETKTISGDLISKKKTNNQEKKKIKKRLDVEVLARRVLVHLSTINIRTVQATQGVHATYSK